MKKEIVAYHALVLLLCLFPALMVKAVPAYPHPVSITQPDGTTLTVILHGDENQKIRTTTDGYVIRKNDQGYYVYAVRNSLNQYVPGEKIARDEVQRSQNDLDFLKTAVKISDLQQTATGSNKISRAPAAANIIGFPKTGSPKSLVIMVNFSDRSFVISNPQDAFSRLLNQQNYSDNGGTGSAKDYFIAASYGLFAPEFDVVGPYTLPNTMAYYGANDSYGDDVKPAYMIVDACKAADNAGVDFTQYDTDGDGYIDNIFVYYAGYNEAEWGPDNSIWPHRWVVYPGSNYTGTQSSVRFDGKTLYDYACTSELKGSSGSNMCGIGTFTHEFGHVIGMPDYYCTDGSSKSTLDDWSIMDGGAYLNQGRTPPTYSAYDRFFMGWLTPEELNAGASKTLYPISQAGTSSVSSQSEAFLLSQTTHNLVGDNPSPKEFFVMEYRKKTGWDAYLPAEGLLFWHIDYDQAAWDNNEPNNYSGTTQTSSSHMRVYLQPLSGSTTTPGTAFTSGSFTPKTWLGTDINRPVTEITKTPETITFKIMGGVAEVPDMPEITAGVINSALQFPEIAVNTSKTKYLNIKTTDLTGDLTVSITGTNAGLFSASTGTITAAAANSQAGAALNVIYTPDESGSHTAILTISGGGLSPEKVIELNGTAR